MRRRKWLKWAGGVVGLAALGGLIAARSMRPVEVVAAPVTRGHAVDAIYATGTVEAERRVTVKAKVAGPIVALKVREGETIGSGALLASIDNPAAAIELRRGEVDAKAASAQIGPRLAATRAKITALDAQLAAAKRELGRTKSLVAAGALGSAEQEQATDRVNELEAQLAAARADLNAEQIELDAGAKRAKEAVSALETRVSETEVRAPQAGVVLAKYVEPGEVVALNQALFKVGDTKSLLLEVNIDETDIARVHDGIDGKPPSKVAARLNAFPGKSFDGQVVMVLPDANRETKSYLAKVRLDDPPSGLRSGMTAEVNIIVDERDGVLLGAGAAQKLGVKTGDVVTLVGPRGVRMTGRVHGTFAFSVPAIDDGRAFVPLKMGQTVLSRPDTVSRIEVRLGDPEQAEVYAQRMQRLFGIEVESWQKVNESFIGLFVVQDIVTAFIIGSILVVGGFGILAIQIMLVLQKRRDVALLRATGFRRADILRMFLLQGAVISTIGATVGSILGHFILSGVSRIELKATTAIGRTDHMLVSDDPKMYFYGFVFALVVGILASLVPAMRASKVEPVDVLRGMVG
ncbi:MAG: HlyD family efflux transporter periplasmic adaptor subunit [Polyangiaceae bacterium]|nr:HlyD family efflux transporter periplasmic adaptor subunit [Polyangiaceae bacterium]